MGGPLVQRLLGMYSQHSSGGSVVTEQPGRRAAAAVPAEAQAYLPAALRVYHPVLLPPQAGPDRPTLVLDLDRTLIDCITIREQSDTEPDFIYTDSIGLQAKVWKRPFLTQFLMAVSASFEVVLFTAAGPRHADCVLRTIDPDRRFFAHRLYGQHTSECKAWGWVKDLSRLGRPLARTLLVDDSQMAGLLQPCNLVPVRPFVHSDPRKDFDTVLPELLHFLMEKVLHAADVREVIAAYWNKISRRPRRVPLRPNAQRHPGASHPHPQHPTAAAVANDSGLLSVHSCPHAAAPSKPGGEHAPQLPTAISQPHGRSASEARWSGASTRSEAAAGGHQCAAALQGCGCCYGLDYLSSMVASGSLCLEDVEDCDEQPVDGATDAPSAQDASGAANGLKRSQADRHLSNLGDATATVQAIANKEEASCCTHALQLEDAPPTVQKDKPQGPRLVVVCDEEVASSACSTPGKATTDGEASSSPVTPAPSSAQSSRLPSLARALTGGMGGTAEGNAASTALGL